MDWGKEILAAVSDMSSKEIGALEKLIGVSIISNTIEEVIGVDAEVVKTSTLDKLGETVSNNLTINNAKDKFGIEFPDMPIFADAEFLASPLATAFSDFESYTLGEVIEITEESNAVLRELKDVAIKDNKEYVPLRTYDDRGRRQYDFEGVEIQFHRVAVRT